jgi:YidC/Oxa1 family membrane protein insertase
MDTQRLILFVIFAFSALFLWEAWQREHRPPPPPVTQAAPGAAVEVPVPTATPAPGAAATVNPNAVPAAAPAGETIAIRTDLYSADIDTAGAIISQVALNEHRDTEDKTRPYLLLQKNADRTFVAQSGLLGEGLPNHRTVWQPLPGPREGPGGWRSVVATRSGGEMALWQPKR